MRPRSRRRTLAVVAALGACQPAPPGPRTVIVPPPPPAAPAAPEGEPVACDAALEGLPFGASVHDESAFIVLEGAARAPLARALPGLDQAGLALVSATALELGGDATARLVYLRPRDAVQARDLDRRGAFPVLQRALASCAGDRGYALLTRPEEIARDARVDVFGVERVVLPSGALATSAIEEITESGGDYRDGLLLATTAPPSLTRLAEIGGWKTLDADHHEHVRALPGSGWYPVWRASASTFLRVRYDEHRVTFDRVAVADAAGARPNGDGAAATPAWVLAGEGDAPAWCASRGLRCSALEAFIGYDLEPPLTWIAGVWDSAAAARDAARELGVDAATTRWIPVDASRAGAAPVGPDGRPGLLELALVARAYPPPP